RMAGIAQRNQRKALQQKNQRRRESAHERKTVAGTDQHINQRHRPSQKNEHQADRQKIKLTRTKEADSQRHTRAHDRREKTDHRNEKKTALHWKELNLRASPGLGNAPLRKTQCSRPLKRDRRLTLRPRPGSVRADARGDARKTARQRARRAGFSEKRHRVQGYHAHSERSLA